MNTPVGMSVHLPGSSAPELYSIRRRSRSKSWLEDDVPGCAVIVLWVCSTWRVQGNAACSSLLHVWS